MHRNLLSSFGSPLQRVTNALNSLHEGSGILVVDDEDRENEGDLIFSAKHLNTRQMALLIRECIMGRRSLFLLKPPTASPQVFPPPTG